MVWVHTDSPWAVAEVVSCKVIRVALLALECTWYTFETLDFDPVYLFQVPVSFTVRAVWSGLAAVHALDSVLFGEAWIRVFALKGDNSSIHCSERPGNCCGHGFYFAKELGFLVLIVGCA